MCCAIRRLVGVERRKFPMKLQVRVGSIGGERLIAATTGHVVDR
jgi:hypothetical protein